MNDGLTHALRLSRQEFSWVLGTLRHTSMVLRNRTADTDELVVCDVFTDGGVLGPASAKDLECLADALNTGQRDLTPEACNGPCFECGAHTRLDTVSGVARHITEDGGVDHDRDADHVPRLEHEWQSTQREGVST